MIVAFGAIKQFSPKDGVLSSMVRM